MRAKIKVILLFITILLIVLLTCQFYLVNISSKNYVFSKKSPFYHISLQCKNIYYLQNKFSPDVNDYFRCDIRKDIAIISLSHFFDVDSKPLKGFNLIKENLFLSNWWAENNNKTTYKYKKNIDDLKITNIYLQNLDKDTYVVRIYRYSVW